ALELEVLALDPARVDRGIRESAEPARVVVGLRGGMEDESVVSPYAGHHVRRPPVGVEEDLGVAGKPSNREIGHDTRKLHRRSPMATDPRMIPGTVFLVNLTRDVQKAVPLHRGVLGLRQSKPWG